MNGIVHQTMTILSSFTYSEVVPNLYEFLFSAEQPKHFLLNIFYLFVWKENTVEVNGEQQLLPTFFQTSSIFVWTIPSRNNLRKFLRSNYEEFIRMPILINS